MHCKRLTCYERIQTELNLAFECQDGGAVLGTAHAGGLQSENYSAGPTGHVPTLGVITAPPIPPGILIPREAMDTGCPTGDAVGTCSGWFSVSAENHAGLSAATHFRLDCVECGDLEQPCCSPDDSCEQQYDCRGGTCCVPCSDGSLCTATSSTGRCRSHGRRSCGCTSSACLPGSPRTESCNGLDDDCNGVVDDGVQESCGVGACANGTRNCSMGSWGPCSTDSLRTDEVCNGVDDDCNGTIDDIRRDECVYTPDGCQPGFSVRGHTICERGRPVCNPSVRICNRVGGECGYGSYTPCTDSSLCRPGYVCMLQEDCPPGLTSTCIDVCRENQTCRNSPPACWTPEDVGEICYVP